MPPVPDVSAIVESVKARIKQIEGELAKHERLSEELERLRDALGRLEGAARSRVSGRREAARPAARSAGRAKPAGGARSRAAEVGGVLGRRPAPARARSRWVPPAHERAGPCAAGAEQGQGARGAQGRADDRLGDREHHRHRHRDGQHAADEAEQERRGGPGRARIPPAGALGVAERVVGPAPGPRIGHGRGPPTLRRTRTQPMAGGIEMETHAGALSAVRAVSTAPKTRGRAWRSWSGRGINRLERAGSQHAPRAAGDQDRATWRRPSP